MPRTLFPRIRSADQARPEPRRSGSVPSALIVIAGNVNYFYDRTGQRIAEALRNLGGDAIVATIRDLPPQDFDCCFLIGPGEIVAGHGDRADAFQRLAKLRANCRFLAAWNLDSMATRWSAPRADCCVDSISMSSSIRTSIPRTISSPPNCKPATSSSTTG